MKWISWIFILALTLSSCGPTPSVTRTIEEEEEGAEVADPVFSSNETLYWYSFEDLGSIFTLNQYYEKEVWIRGRVVHDWLNNPNELNNLETYCLVISYNHEGAKINLRARAIPDIKTDLGKGSKERKLRIDFSQEIKNGTTCNGNLPFIDFFTVPGEMTGIGTDKTAFVPTKLCESCSNQITGSNISIYKAQKISNTNFKLLNFEDRVPLQFFNPNDLRLNIDFRYLDTIDNKCQDSACREKGKDCCLAGVCAIDGEVRPGAESNQDWNQAQIDKEESPNFFVNYPQLYYVCAERPSTPEEETLPSTNELIELAELRFEVQVAAFKCMEGGNSIPANYEKCNDKYLCLALWETTDPGYRGTCSDLDGKSAADRFLDVRSLVWSACGCRADPFPIDPDDPSCPDFTLQSLEDALGNIIKVSCDTPKPNVDDTLIQTLWSVPARTAPHRFYSADDGQPIDSVEEIQEAIPPLTPEGLEFFYLDDINKTDPQNDTFNMNAILGQFKVDLTQARPAVTIPVTIAQNYIIQTNSGNYNPCPQCSNDNWEDSFFIKAPSDQGRGLEAVGFTTARNEVGSNQTRGNYEDTLFGRACWLPPTMLPFSHKPNGDVKLQRRNRLLTQAALYINGYQQDWYGFNQGALIGSFDGVKWFAIGTARRVFAKSDKLFLAINGPFADLADTTSLEVTVEVESGINTIADVDYDPLLEFDDSRQNRGGSCQKYHVCENDTDCISNLGWEYRCAEVNSYVTKWPKFNPSAEEEANAEFSDANATIFLQKFNPVGRVKRCVYRGNGSLCKMNYKVGLFDQKTEKLLTCAPNFYCDRFNNTDFNKRLIRTPATPNIFQYGQETDFLGRPETYISGNSTLPTAVVENLKHNASLYSNDVNDFGLCRPGKKIVTTQTTDPLLTQHATADSKRRTDFISQVGSCNSGAIGNDRVTTCPLIEDQNTEVEYFENLDYESEDWIARHRQNMCGGESQIILGNGERMSTFEIIELERLSTLPSIDSPAIVKDACFRRAGAVCFSNLDCAPGELHAEQAEFFGPDQFGGTQAEKDFWTESLICGQGTIKPVLGLPENQDAINAYDMSLNRCCRKVGQDITMNTEYLKGTNDPDLIPDNGINNDTLIVDKYPYENPTSANRYSRYVSAQPSRGPNGHVEPAYNEVPAIKTAGGVPVTPKEYQWRTINEQGRRTCCGTGFVRKFADGTHDWNKTNRLAINIQALTCLNYQDNTIFKRPEQVDSDNYKKEVSLMCINPGKNGDGSSLYPPEGEIPIDTTSSLGTGGCSQVPLPQVSGNSTQLPRDLGLGVSQVTTVPDERPAGTLVQEKTLSYRVPYIPQPFVNTIDISTETRAPSYFINQLAAAQSVYLPIYIGGKENITIVTTSYYDEDGEVQVDVPSTLVNCDNLSKNPEQDLNENEWCVQNSAYTGFYDVLHIRGAQNPNGAAIWDYGGFTVTFNTINTKNYSYKAGDPMKPSDRLNEQTIGMAGGNALYYTTKLGRLELLGVPQIFYEPLYCNTNREDLIDGMFKVNPPTRTEFEKPEVSFFYDANKNDVDLNQIYDTELPDGEVDYANPSSKIAYQDQISLPQVFSSKDFTCCLNLGTITDVSASCCSNYSVETTVDGVAGRVCALPRGTDLHVYFNRFISGDGVGEEQPGGGLVDTDFTPLTGEPRPNDDVQKKMQALGEAYCGSKKVRSGATFGYFFAQPNSGYFTHAQESGKYYSIIDNSLDNSTTEGTSAGNGYIRFQEGYRWSHHLYCAPE
ncbi:MAG: hypothetical protein DRQ88_03700 [Epsilonproteobacteria bacterium]|nr:MAG: hypothetical protein DRQ89_03790 [Campylobacterota bacterium]RLA67279.1 MAG: hypothetical protein DRQ88_03700 [Campylobacterota bacterium]